MLNKALRIIRVFEGLTQVEAAQKVGVSQSYLSEIERGIKTPTLDVIRKYGEVFGIPASAIMLFSENLADGSSAQRARTLVAGKVLALMEFLERRSDRVDAE
jgi:transcriptional regulator with XRE-family HTH domain